MQEFLDWQAKISPEVQKVLRMLAEPLQDDPQALIQAGFEVECQSARMGALMSKADSFLAKVKLISLPDKESGKSEIDRKLTMEAETAPIRQVRDTLEHICNSIKVRINFIQSILKHESMFTEVNLKR